MIEQELRQSRNKGILFVVLTSLLWSTGGLLIKSIDWNPLAISGGRSFVASLLLLVYIKKPKFTKSKSQIYGAISYSCSVILFVVANKLTTAANVILLQYTAPIFVAILGVLILKEKIHKYDLITIAVVFLGMILFFIQDVSVGNMLGNILAVISGFFLAGVTVSLRMQKDGSGIETTLLGNIITAIVALPFIVQVDFDLRSIFLLILLGVFQLGLAYILYVKALELITAFEAILVTALEPILNPLWVFLLVGENPGIYSIFGGAIVLGAVVLRGTYVTKLEQSNN